MVTQQYPQRYRWDFIGLSTDDKPTPATSEKVVNGSTFYCSDTSKLYVFCDGTWYERKPLGGGGGGGGTEYTAGDGINISSEDVISVDTTAIQPKLTAGSNITISDNTISATDTTYSSFTGTDGTAAGTTGLVPAPATTDADKFLKSDGTWATAGGGGSASTIKTLTSADFNWNSTTNSATEPFNCVGIWLLPPGLYKVDGLTYNTEWRVRKDSGGNDNNYATFLVTTDSTSTNPWVFGFKGQGLESSITSEALRLWCIKTDGTTYSTTTFIHMDEIVDSLTNNSGYRPLSANQGRVLKDLIDALDARVTALEGN